MGLACEYLQTESLYLQARMAALTNNTDIIITELLYDFSSIVSWWSADVC